MNGKQSSKKPTYRDLQNEIAQLAGFMQKISSVLLQLDGELVGLRNELEENKTIKKKVREGEGETDSPESASQTSTGTQGPEQIRQEEGAVKKVVTRAKTEDYFPSKEDT